MLEGIYPPLSSAVEKLTCAFEPAGWTLRDQERGRRDLWALTPAARISGRVVQLRSEEVRGDHYNEGQRGGAGTEGKRRRPTTATAVEEKQPQIQPHLSESAPSLPFHSSFSPLFFPRRYSGPVWLIPGWLDYLFAFLITPPLKSPFSLQISNKLIITLVAGISSGQTKWLPAPPHKLACNGLATR